MSSSRSSSRSRRHRTKRATSATSDVAKQVSDEIVRPASSMELSYPKKPILATLGYEGARHVISDYLPSSRFDNVVGMRLPDLSQQTANLVRDLRDTLRRIGINTLCLSQDSQFYISVVKCRLHTWSYMKAGLLCFHVFIDLRSRMPHRISAWSQDEPAIYLLTFIALYICE